MFLGTVRDMTDGKVVREILFEADEPEAIEQLKQIRDEVIDKFGATDVSIVHRIGTLQVGENIVIIAVGAGHRPEAFDGCRYAIERLKEFVHIWKKEFRSEWLMFQKKRVSCAMQKLLATLFSNPKP